MRRKLTPEEIRLYRRLARAARDLQKAKEKADRESQELQRSQQPGPGEVKR
jgi:hypothetical protein